LAIEKHHYLVSTQTTLKERLEADPALLNLYSVMADQQSSGRGRADREWVSLKGNLHVSILIRDQPFKMPTWVPLWVSISVHRSLKKLGAQTERITLKWPNDLWLDGNAKLGGVLCEKKGSEIIAGIGLNLVSAPIAESAVVPFSGESPSAEQVLDVLLNELANPVRLEQVQSYYQEHALFCSGETVTWLQMDQKHEGVVVGLGQYGELLVDTPKGRTPLYSEDVRSVSSPAVKDQSTSPSE